MVLVADLIEANAVVPVILLFFGVRVVLLGGMVIKVSIRLPSTGRVQMG
jgi:hypothetical protein